MSIKLAVIYGSTREGRFCDTVVRWAMGQLARREEFVVDLVDPAHMASPNWHLREDSAEMISLKLRIESADAYIIVTPEYNHSYPAPLKFLIDSVHHQWQAKPVAFISFGGISGGLRAVEHLRHVFAELRQSRSATPSASPKPGRNLTTLALYDNRNAPTNH